MAHRVVIVGGGFAGLYAARSLRSADAELTLIDRRNFHLFQPLLYQVATGALSPGEIASPLRNVLRRQKNARVLLGEAANVDVTAHEVVLSDSARIPYDTLVVATGATHHYFGHPEWEAFAPGLKTIEDAAEIRNRILLAFERAERETDAEMRRALLTFVVVGAGPTGVELAGALGEISRDTLRNDFRSINPAEANIFLIEGAGRVLPPYPEKLSRAAEESLIALGVQTRANSVVTCIDADGVIVNGTRIAAKTVLWAAGVQASPLGKALGAPLDKAGRVMVERDLSVPGHPEILVIGDLAHIEQDGASVPGVAPAAMQQGHHAARAVMARVRGVPTPAFHYFNKGNLATIGGTGRWRISGRFGFRGIWHG